MTVATRRKKTETAPVAPVAAPDPAVGPFAVTVPASKLRAALAKVAPAVGHRFQSVPIILGVRLQATDSGLTVACTNLDVHATVAVTDATPAGPRSAVVVGLKLFRQVLIGVTGNVTLTSGGGGGDYDLTIRGEGGTIRVHTMPVADWPKTPTVNQGDTFPLDPSHLAAVLCAASNDDARPMLTGVRLEKGAMAATDSYRLHYLPDSCPDYPPLTVPAWALQWASRLTEQATLTVPPPAPQDHIPTTRTIFDVKVEGGGQTWIIRTIGGDYPDWRSLTKNPPPHKLAVDRTDLLAALTHVRRIPIPASWSPAPVELRLTANKMTLTRKVTDLGIAETTIKGTWDGPDKFTFALSVGYLTDTVNAGSGDTVTISVDDAIKPVFVEDDGAVRRLLMPVRIR